jgi:hypothetical protein
MAQSEHVMPPEGTLARIVVEDAISLNRTCRGNSGNEPLTWRACGARNAAFDIALRLGWCYSEPDWYGYQDHWHECITNPVPVARSVDEFTAYLKSTLPAPSGQTCDEETAALGLSGTLGLETCGRQEYTAWILYTAGDRSEYASDLRPAYE